MRIGIIGAGNMATAIIKGLMHSVPVGDIFVSDKNEQSLVPFKKMGIGTGTNADTAEFAEILIIAVKPTVCEEVFMELEGKTAGKTVVSIAAGISIGFVKQMLGNDQKVVRVMPNTPALIGEGMAGISYEPPVNENEARAVYDIFSAFGKAIIIPETLMDACVSVSGSSPAYAFMFIEAMAKAAQKMGMSREDAVLSAAQSMLGAGKMVLETGEEPNVLKEKVCSPGGTTIEAVRVFEEQGLENMVFEAMQACADKSRKLKR